MRTRIQLAGAAALVATVVPTSAIHADDRQVDERVAAILADAVTASLEVSYAGALTVVSFGERGPQVTELDLTRGDGTVRVTHGTGWELGRAHDQGFPRSSDLLVRVGGVERAPTQLHRLSTKYTVDARESVVLDTGPALPLDVTERATGTRREVLYVDERTGLIVRRETFGADGAPMRVVAFTELDVGARQVVVPDGTGDLDEREFVAEVAATERAGFHLPAVLPRGYELLAAVEVQEAPTPTLHLVYGDGLYTLSVFQQQGSLAHTAVRGATELTTPGGGAVWRWPGSEPRRVVWSGDGSTFTALTDAPVDELVSVLAGLPTDPAPSTLERLARGIARVGRWLWPTDEAATDGLQEPE